MQERYEMFVEMMSKEHYREDPLLVLAVQETWAGVGEEPRDIPGYRWVHKGRDDRSEMNSNTAGGVGFLIHDSIPDGSVSLVNMNKHNLGHSTFWIRIEDGLKGMYFGTIYVDGNAAVKAMKTTPELLWKAHADFMEHMLQKVGSEQVYLMGDFNAHLGSEQENDAIARKLPQYQPTHSKKYREGMFSLLRKNNLLICNGRRTGDSFSKPTRYPEDFGKITCNANPTQIDFIVTNIHALQTTVTDISVSPWNQIMTDHCMVKASLRLPRYSTIASRALQEIHPREKQNGDKGITRINYKKLGDERIALKIKLQLNEAMKQWSKEHGELKTLQQPYTNMNNKIIKVLKDNLGEQEGTANKKQKQTPSKKREEKIVKMNKEVQNQQQSRRHWRNSTAKKQKIKSGRRRAKIGRALLRRELGGQPSTKPRSRTDDLRLKDVRWAAQKKLDKMTDTNKSAKVAQLLGLLDKAIKSQDPEAIAVLLRRIKGEWANRPGQSMMLIEEGKALLTDTSIAQGHQNFWADIADEEEPTSKLAKVNKKWLKEEKQKKPKTFFPQTIGPDFLKNNTTKDSHRRNMCSAFTTDEIRSRIVKSNKKSTPGKDTISYMIMDMLDDDGLQALAKLFTKCMQEGETPKEWKEAVVKMLYKLDPHTQKERTTDPANYRGISLLSCVGKIFESCLHHRIMTYLDAFGLLDDIQNGFRPKRSAEQHLFALDESILQGGKNLPVCYIDIKKAFPSVRRDSLLRALHDVGVTGSIWYVICSMYENTQSTIVIGTSASTGYEIRNGVREGAILSPLLFTIFLNPLLLELRKLKLGLHHGKTWCGALAYADDLVLIGANLGKDPEGKELQTMLDMCDMFANQHMMQFGYKKTAIVIYSPTAEKTDHVPTWTMNNMDNSEKDDVLPAQIEIKKSYKYLGLRFSDDLKWDLHVDHEPTPDDPEMGLVQKVRAKLAGIKSTLLNYSVLSPKTAMQVINTSVVPIVVYGAAIWAPSEFDESQPHTSRLSAATLTKLQEAFTSTLRAVLGLGFHANKMAMHRELGWGNLRMELARSKVTLMNSLLKLQTGRLQTSIMRFRFQQLEFRHGKATPHNHKSLMSKNNTSLSSYFLVTTLSVMHNLRGTPNMRTAIMGHCRWTNKQYKAMKKIKLPILIRDRLLAEFTGGAAENYYNMQGWAMLPDIASIQNADPTCDRHLIAHFRTHAHALGSSISKRCRPKNRSEICPSCCLPYSETFSHCVHKCGNIRMKSISKHHLPKLMMHMKKKSATWTAMYRDAESNDERTKLILQSANFLAGKKFGQGEARYAAHILGKWLHRIRIHHVEYKRFGIHAQDIGHSTTELLQGSTGYGKRRRD